MLEGRRADEEKGHLRLEAGGGLSMMNQLPDRPAAPGPYVKL